MSPTCSVSLPSTSTSINRPQSSLSTSQFFSNFSGAEELSGSVEENRKKNRKSRTKTQSPPPKKRIDREEVLETLINRQPFVPIKKVSSPTEENLEKFFSGIIDTMKNFPKYQIT